MKIAVGSTNPVKIAAVQAVMTRAWPAVEIVSLDVPSGVSVMPFSDNECIMGARNRATAARVALDADLGVGLEGGVQPHTVGLMLVGWVVIVASDGRAGVGGSPRLPLPDSIASRILAGAELGPVMDDLLGEANIKQKGGAIGALTGGLVMRQEAFATAVAYALSPFVAPTFYQ
jgi:inosine/xanthosine triphosphatase